MVRYFRHVVHLHMSEASEGGDTPVVESLTPDDIPQPKPRIESTASPISTPSIATMSTTQPIPQDHPYILSEKELQKCSQSFQDSKQSAEAMAILVSGIMITNPNERTHSGMCCYYVFQCVLILSMLFYDVTSVRRDLGYAKRILGWLKNIWRFYDQSRRSLFMAPGMAAFVKQVLESGRWIEECGGGDDDGLGGKKYVVGEAMFPDPRVYFPVKELDFFKDLNVSEGDGDGGLGGSVGVGVGGSVQSAEASGDTPRPCGNCEVVGGPGERQGDTKKGHATAKGPVAETVLDDGEIAGFLDINWLFGLERDLRSSVHLF
ncbi:hypothetical protein HDU76_009677 [Blyttiomyces sp. JEL0837]|nr:hypothetical protein HDU76_009677 [Blyttiomyces sp. JEL0837]